MRRDPPRVFPSVVDQIQTIRLAWRQASLGTAISGMTLAEFEVALAEPLDLRKEIDWALNSTALAQRILASVEPQGHAAIEAAWAAEIRERISRYDSGETPGIPASEVFAELDRRLAQ